MFVYSFPPRNADIFYSNCKRLSNNQQYSYLISYFLKYYPKFSHVDRWATIEEIIIKIPRSNWKLTIIKTYQKYTQKKSFFKKKSFYYAGLIYFFQQKKDKAYQT